MPRPGDPYTGGPRPIVQARVVSPVKARVIARATDETEGVISEIVDRLIRYALPRMPRGWDEALTTTEEEHAS